MDSVMKGLMGQCSPLDSSVASMEQMEQLLPWNAKGHVCNSRRS